MTNSTRAMAASLKKGGWEQSQFILRLKNTSTDSNLKSEAIKHKDHKTQQKEHLQRPTKKGHEADFPHRGLFQLLSLACAWRTPELGAQRFKPQTSASSRGSVYGHLVDGFDFGFGLVIIWTGRPLPIVSGWDHEQLRGTIKILRLDPVPS